jgi:hypothetical protein
MQWPTKFDGKTFHLFATVTSPAQKGMPFYALW